MSVELQDWDALSRKDIKRLSGGDEALGVVPILMLIDTAGDVRVISPLSARATADLYLDAAKALNARGLQ